MPIVSTMPAIPGSVRVACSSERAASSSTRLTTRAALAMAPSSPYMTVMKITTRTRPSTEARSEEHTSELQSLMRISYAVFCLKKKKRQNKQHSLQKHKLIHHNPQITTHTVH